MKKYGLIAVSILTAALALPALAAAAPIAITREQIAAALGSAGVRIAPGQITLLSDVTAANGAPALTIESIEPWSESRARVRLNCANHTDCLPFVVLVHCTQEDAVQLARWNAERSPAITAREKSRSESYVMRAGSSAVLLLEGGHVHIRLPVVCLENGTPGQTIRVASKDHKQTYTAKVMEDSTLRGNL